LFLLLGFLYTGYGSLPFLERTRTEGDVFARVLPRIDEMSDARDLIRAAAWSSRDRTSAAACRATRECGTGDTLGWAESWRTRSRQHRSRLPAVQQVAEPVVCWKRLVAGLEDRPWHLTCW